jgi:N-carbamoylputrescine amidase
MGHASAFRLGLVQLSVGPDPSANLDHAVARVKDAAARGAEIVVLPELFRTQYFCQAEDPANFELAEPIPGPTTDRLGAVAKERGVAIVVSVFERRAPGLYHNSAVVLDADGSIAGMYRKMHIPDDPLFYEKFYFTPGDLGFRAISTRFARVGTLVCWDQWYPEAARLTALDGADVLVYPTAIGWHPAEKAALGTEQHDAWETIQRGHAIANGLYVAAVNRTGHEGAPEGGLDFWGQSFVADPFGVVVKRAPSDREETLVVSCDPARTESVRQGWPFLRDRRIDAYSGIALRWRKD